MAINSKVNTATDAVSAVRENPYVQKALSDEQLHDEVRSAFAAAQSLFEQLRSNAAPSKKLTNDKLFDELQTLATSIRDASDSIRDAKPRRSGGGGFGRLIGLTIVGGIAAIALSEGLRTKLLDALFGAEEEFQYTPSSAVNGTAPAAPPAATATNGSAASTPDAAASVKTAAKPKAAAKKPAAKKDDAGE